MSRPPLPSRGQELHDRQKLIDLAVQRNERRRDREFAAREHEWEEKLLHARQVIAVLLAKLGGSARVTRADLDTATEYATLWDKSRFETILCLNANHDRLHATKRKPSS